MWCRIEKCPDGFFQAERVLQAGKCSQLVDWYQRHQNLHRSCHSSSSLAPAQLHARLAAQPPASILYLRFTVVSHDLTVFVWCFHPSQTRRWSCGRSVSETSVQRATTWRMRTDEFETHRPSPHYGWEEFPINHQSYHPKHTYSFFGKFIMLQSQDTFKLLSN